MVPRISEFSYGFALTNELVGSLTLKTAPIFPSLIEEGKKGGGYDVKLDAPAVPLFLQFKRAECMTRKSARECALGATLEVPFYRFNITIPSYSFQHESLVELDDGKNAVFYAAPRFHTLSEINDAWKSKNVASRSIFVKPASIGLIKDLESHTVAYDNSVAYFCSDPKQIQFVNFAGLLESLATKLNNEDRELRAMLPEWRANLRGAAARAGIQRTVQGELHGIPAVSQIEEANPLDGERLILREVSDDAMELLNAQLFVIQKKP